MHRKKLYIHIGYPKTATTTLQRHCFSKINGLNYLGIYYQPNKLGQFEPQVVDALIFCDQKKISAISENFSNELYKKIDERPALYSNEGISNQFLAPRMDYSGKCIPTSPAKVARAIRTLFDESLFDVKIIMSVRNQPDALSSLYAQSHKGCYQSIVSMDTFDKYIHDILENKNSFVSAGFRYDEVAQELRRTFGDGSVFILPFEHLSKAPELAIAELCAFMGINCLQEMDLPVLNKTSSLSDGTRICKPRTAYNILSEIKKKYIPGQSLGFSWLVPKLKKIKLPKFGPQPTASMTNEQKISLAQFFLDSNMKLKELTPVDIESLGYLDICKMKKK